MTPHPEGGWYKETYRSSGVIPVAVLPAGFEGDRTYSTSILFLLKQGVFSAFHRIRSDEVWHFHAGDALLVHEIGRDGDLKTHRLGSDPDKGQSFQTVINAGSWFASEVEQGGSYSLVGCTVSPGFDFRDFELAAADQLSAQYPQHCEIVARLCRK